MIAMLAEDADLYTVLEVRPSASQAEITRAYRSLLRRHHPDTRPPTIEASQRAASDATLADVIAAYAVLGDPARRAAYDRRCTPGPSTAAIRPRLRTAPRARVADGSTDPPIVAGPVRWDPSPRHKP